MPRKAIPKTCSCGCGEMTKGGDYRPGHDAKLYRAILLHIGGDVTKLRRFVEQHSGSQVVINYDE